jgi:hypothetical protein
MGGEKTATGTHVQECKDLVTEKNIAVYEAMVVGTMWRHVCGSDTVELQARAHEPCDVVRISLRTHYPVIVGDLMELAEKGVGHNSKDIYNLQFRFVKS